MTHELEIDSVHPLGAALIGNAGGPRKDLHLVLRDDDGAVYYSAAVYGFRLEPSTAVTNPFAPPPAAKMVAEFELTEDRLKDSVERFRDVQRAKLENAGLL